MHMHLNGIYLPHGGVDAKAGLNAVDRLGADSLAAASEQDILGYGWILTVRGDPDPMPWDSDEEFQQFVNSDRQLLSGSSQMTLELLDAEHPGAADRYRDYLLASARTWLDNFAYLIGGTDRTFENGIVTRIPVRPNGTLLFSPENISHTDGYVSECGEVIGAAYSAFPDVARAAGAHPLEDCTLTVEVP